MLQKGNIKETVETTDLFNIWSKNGRKKRIAWLICLFYTMYAQKKTSKAGFSQTTIKMWPQSNTIKWEEAWDTNRSTARLNLLNSFLHLSLRVWHKALGYVSEMFICWLSSCCQKMKLQQNMFNHWLHMKRHSAKLRISKAIFGTVVLWSVRVNKERRVAAKKIYKLPSGRIYVY